MFKHAFLTNYRNQTRQSYKLVYEDQENCCVVAGMTDMQAAIEYVKKLREEDFRRIDLGRQFNERDVIELRKAAGDDITVSGLNYNLNELARLGIGPKTRRRGIIIHADGLDSVYEMLMDRGSERLHVALVSNMADARKAARNLVDRQIELIHLCSWFDILKYESIIKAIDYRVPVGTCGEMDPDKLCDLDEGDMYCNPINHMV